MRKHLSLPALRAVLMVLLIAFGIGNAWGSGYGILHLTSEAPAKGLVYANKDNSAPSSDESYAASSNSTSAKVCNSSGSAPRDFYGWAKGARGWKWASWQIGSTVSNPSYSNASDGGSCTLKSTTENGSVAASVFTLNGGRQTSSERLVTAKWKEDGNATITFAQTVGGSYTANYKYVKVNTSTNKFTSVSKDYTVSPTSGNVKPSETAWDGTTVDNRSYVNDKITLSTTAANLIRWEEVNAADNSVTNLTPTVNGTTRSYVYQVVDGRTATIRAVFKSASLGEISGDKQISVNNLTNVYNYSLTVPVTNIIGDWAVGDFTVVFQNKNGAATFTKGSVQYTAGLLTIPFTYQANAEGNTTIDVVVSTPYGAQTSCQIVASAEVTVDYEAQILLAGQTDPSEGNTGTLAAMLANANGMSGDFTLKLMNPVSITEPLSFTNSFTFDINGKTITSSGNAAISIDAASIIVRFVDGSFVKAGKVVTEKSLDGVISAIRYTAAGKITLDGGTIIAHNTSTASGAKAYAVNVSNGGIFFMTAGSYGRVSAESENEAVAIYVASSTDFATMNGGVVEAQAKTNAYGVWSAGVANITDATISAETQTGINACGVYVNGSTTTLTNTTIDVLAKTTQAYGAYVKTGRLNMNGGTVVSKANSDAYGVHIAAGATASVLMGADITVSATVAGNARGLNNLGTLIANNADVHATAATTGATAVNSETSATSTTIDGGSYVATAGSGTVYGLHHQYGGLSVDGGEFHGIATGGSAAYGVRTVANGTIQNATLWGETQGAAHTAYGYVAGTAGKTTTLTKCVIKGESVTATAYAIYSRAIVQAIDCELTATANNGNRAAAFWAENGTNTITRCNAAVTASEAEAWGVNHLAGACAISGGSYTVLARQAKASAVADTKAYGVQNAASLTTNISDAAFSVTGNNTTYAQKVYGLYISGTANCTNSTFDVESRIDAYGVYGDGTSTLSLSGNRFDAEATTTTGAYGMYSNKNFTTDNDSFSATAKTTSAYALNFGSSAKGTVYNGKFAAIGTGDYAPINRSASNTNVVLRGGFYTTSTNLPYYVSSECDIFRVDQSEPEYTEGYRYVIAEENPARYVCYIGNTGYATLEAAMQYAIDNPTGTYTIVMSQPYTLPAGNYTLPSNASLLIPYKDNQSTISTTPTRHYDAEVIAEYLRLTVAGGVNWNVDGKIEVSSKMYCKEATTAYVNGSYGCMELKANSILQLNSGAKMYAWGFIIGSGDIKVKGGAEVREFFQALDLPTIGTLFDHKDDYASLKHFPCSQYFIQNIEAPTTYYYNSKLIASMYIGYKGDPYGTDNIKLVGTPTGSSDNYLFQIVDDDPSSWVRKEYNASSDRQIWTIGSKAQLGAMTLTISGIPLLGSVTLNSKDYILPLTTNMTINTVEGGRVELTQSVELLAGAEININKTASLVVNQKDSKNEDVNFYVIDASQSYYSTKYVNFSPSWSKSGRPSRSVPDAAINVSGGAIVVKGNFYTTESGANIFSNNDNAGTVSLQKAAPAAGTLSYYSSGTKTKNITPAQLKNGNGTYTPTAGAIAGTDFGYLNSAWHSSYVNGPFTVIDNIVYAKPSEYVQLKTQQTGTNGKLEGVAESNHTYLTIADKILILQGKGTDASPYEWWEVVATATAGVFECQKPGYEGFYSYNTTAGEWQIVKRNVTFYMDEAKTESTKKVVSVNYMGVPDQSVITSNPTKGITTGYTYQFYGWKSSVTTTEYAWTETLEAAENDMYYTPVFTATKRNYTITLNNAYNGDPVYLEVPYEEMPEYTPRKDATAEFTYSFNGWNTPFVPVNGTATYTAQWTSTKNRYTVTWMNGEDVLETDKNQEYGKLTSYDGATPTKAADNNYAYTFSGWLNSLTGNMRVNNETVTGAITYTAQFSTTPRYMITFANYDGTQLQKEPVTQNETPIYNGVTPARARDLDGYYIFTGWKRNSTGVNYAPNDVLPAATEKETYTAQYSYTNDLFTITLKNVDGNGATWSGKFGEGSTPFYNPNNNDIPVIPTKTGNAQYSYTFDGWSLTSSGAKLDPVPAVTGTAEYWALFAQTTNKYNITFANIDGFGASQTIQVEYGATPECPVVPKKEEGVKTWAFESWAEGALVAVTGDATYTAQFSSTYTTRQFDITFDLDNGTQVVVPVTYGETPSWTGETPIKAADAQYTYTFSGWYPDFEPVTEEASYLAIYTETVRSYTVRFVNWDGTELKSSSLNFGATPTPPSNPTRPIDEVNGKKYTFKSWSPALSNVTGDITYTATYTETNVVASVTTSNNATTFYDSWTGNNGAFNAANTNSAGGCTIKLYSDITESDNTTRSLSKSMTIDLNGHTISARNTNTTKYYIYINGSYTLTIRDSQGGGKIYFEGTGNTNYYTVDVHSSNGVLTVYGGTLEAKNTYNSTSKHAAVAQVFNSNSTVNLYDGQLIASATQGISYTVRHDGSSYGKVFIYGGRLKAGTDIIGEATASRNTLSGGYYSKDPGTNVTIATNYEKVAKANDPSDPNWGTDYTYKVVPKKFTLTWNLNGGTVTTAGTAVAVNATGSPSGSVPYTTALTAPVVTKNAYTFSSWSPSVAATMPAAATTYAAQWTPVSYNITYTLNGGSATNPETYNIETTTFALNNPTKNYYDFAGWTGSNGSTPQTSVSIAQGSTGDKSYTANWTPTNYTISYTLNGGSATNPANYNIETATFTLNNPTKDHYTFAGWTGSNGNTPQTSVSIAKGSTGDKSFTANWTPTNYTISYDLAGGSATNPENYNIETTTFTLNNPTKNGYTFTGWTGSNGSTPQTTVSVTVGSTGDKSYTAHWTPTNYTISYDLAGGSVAPANPESYNIETTTFALNNPTKQGYDFAGWTGSNGNTPQTSVSVNLGSTGNKSFTANWTPRNDTHYTVKHYKQKLDGTYNAEPDEIDNLTGTTATQVTPSRRSYTGFTAPAGQAVAILADGSQVVTYQYTRNSYELAWDANNGTLSGDYTSGSVKYDASITVPTVTRTGHTFTGWTPTFTGKMAAEDMTYVAQYELPQEVVAANGEQVEITSTATTITTIVEVGGTLKVETGNTLTTDHLILEASVDNSGEITGEGSVTVTPTTGTVNFDLTLNTWGRHWHSFGVPWQVDLDEHQLVEIKNKNGEPCNRPLVLDKDYDIVWYNGATRAANHGYIPACWEYVVDYTGERHAQLYPGKAYMIGFASAVGTVRFVKKNDAPIFYTEDVNVMENGYGGDDVNGGWNAIANPKVYHTLMSGMTGVNYAQVHKSDTIGADSYQACSLADHKFVVGTAVYVQAQETQPITINKAGSQSVISAPRRRVQSAQDNVVAHCEVEIAPEGGKMADRVYVQPEDDKADRYVAGKDVSKMGVSNRRAQMWIDRYNQKLCVNTVAPINNKASYPLSIYAPANGEYTIYLNNQPNEDIMLYLTYDGRAIWNLSYSGYVATLDKGTNSHYGLLIIQKAPEVTTGIEETTILNSDAVRKVVVDDKVFIIRNNNVYSVDGQLVK